MAKPDCNCGHASAHHDHFTGRCGFASPPCGCPAYHSSECAEPCCKRTLRTTYEMYERHARAGFGPVAPFDGSASSRVDRMKLVTAHVAAARVILRHAFELVRTIDDDDASITRVRCFDADRALQDVLEFANGQTDIVIHPRGAP